MGDEINPDQTRPDEMSHTITFNHLNGFERIGQRIHVYEPGIRSDVPSPLLDPGSGTELSRITRQDESILESDNTKEKGVKAITKASSLPASSSNLNRSPSVTARSKPRPTSPEDTTAQPDLIIICPWLYASARHVSKYTQHYQSVYPNASILLIEQDQGDLCWRSRGSQLQHLCPAVLVIEKHIHTRRGSECLPDESAPDAKPESGPESKPELEPKVLVHIFSNGGAYTAHMLAEAFSRSSTSTSTSSSSSACLPTGHHGRRHGRRILPITTLILDSTPGIPTPWLNYISLSQNLPRNLAARTLGGAVIWGFVGAVKLAEVLLRWNSPIASARKKLNDLDDTFMQDRVQRLYIYSSADRLVPATDVRAHAADAIEKLALRHEHREGTGKWRVRLENFGQKSGHVRHVTADEERYWRLVRDMVSERGGGSGRDGAGKGRGDRGGDHGSTRLQAKL